MHAAPVVASRLEPQRDGRKVMLDWVQEGLVTLRKLLRDGLSLVADLLWARRSAERALVVAAQPLRAT